MTAAPLLSVSGLNAHYGRAHILRGVSFAIDRGEVVALVGRNGAGKSTTMKSIMGLVPPSAGAVRFDGRDVAGREPFEIARAGLWLCAGGTRGSSRTCPSRRISPWASALPAPDAPRWTGRGAVRALSQPRTHEGPARRTDVRGRAADADDRPHLDGQSQTRAARRALGRAGSRHRRGDGEGDPAVEERRPDSAALGAEPAFLAGLSPIARSSWRRAKSASTAQWRR